jgi:hypothetical protein
MSARVAKLESLLARVQTRAGEPRPVAAAAAAEEIDELDEAVPVDEIDELDEIDEIDDLDEVELDEPGQPESGQVAASTMDDAIDAAEHQPPMTPPPESGEGIASPQIPAQGGPTMEQLGETISLEEGPSQDFELDEPVLDEPDMEEPASHMEAEIAPPRVVPASVPPEQIHVPENAREELERVRLGDSTPVEARVSTRPVISTNVVELVTSSRAFEPKSFLELVDSSLKLK